MLKQVRQAIVQHLWDTYKKTTPHIKIIESALQKRNVTGLPLDHFAVIDLPGPHTGIPQLKAIFSAIGYVARGQGYLPDKQNDFLWMAETDSNNHLAHDVLPQVVVADFRLEELSAEAKNIILKYSEQAHSAPLANIRQLAEQTQLGDSNAAKQLIEIIIQYLAGRDWPLPTVSEFRTVQACNELLAWVLVFGRRPNHFTLSVHLLAYFNNLDAFHHFIENDVQLALNRDGGVMKGGSEAGIAQGSTNGIVETIQLADGKVELPTGFVEFVWRYPREATSFPPKQWNDYFTGFVAQHANHVIESLYIGE